MILGPCINIHRDPLAGRLSESYSEDPKLLGEIAPVWCAAFNRPVCLLM